MFPTSLNGERSDFGVSHRVKVGSLLGFLFRKGKGVELLPLLIEFAFSLSPFFFVLSLFSASIPSLVLVLSLFFRAERLSTINSSAVLRITDRTTLPSIHCSRKVFSVGLEVMHSTAGLHGACKHRKSCFTEVPNRKYWPAPNASSRQIRSISFNRYNPVAPPPGTPSVPSSEPPRVGI